MKKVLTSAQIRQVDSYTIKSQPISSLDLMERAAQCVTNRLSGLFSKQHKIIIFAGPGNNGGDAIAVARQMSLLGYRVQAYLFNIGNKMSADCMANRERLRGCPSVEFHEITSDFIPPSITESDVVVDGLFGTGLSRPLTGGFAAVVKYINSSDAKVVSIDIPSGMMTEDNSNNVMSHVVQADYTLTFHCNKLAFLFAENQKYIGQLEVIDISLIDPDDSTTATPYYIIEQSDIVKAMRPRPQFAHKGTFGHACLIAGKQGMAGAAILAARACMRSGVGKLTVHTPAANALPLQISIPEAILQIEHQSGCYAKPIEAVDYDAMAIGPGIGTEDATYRALNMQLHYNRKPVVLDADAINIIAQHPDLINKIPADSILTPHKKELRGLIGQTTNSYDELQRACRLARQQHIYIIIKGANSAVVSPDGRVIFNTTGNPGMATAGSGDVLTGITLAFLAQDYTSLQAALLATYMHGLAGDMAAKNLSQTSLIASDIIDYLPQAFMMIER